MRHSVLKTALGMEMSAAKGRAKVIAKAAVAGALPGQDTSMAAKLSESRQKAAEVGARLVASPNAAAELATSQWQPMMQVYR